MSTSNPLKVVTPEMRTSYLNVFEARAARTGDKPSRSTVLLISKKHRNADQLISRLKKANKAALEKKFGGKLPKKWHNPIKDGDNDQHLSPAMLEDENRSTYEGMWVINVKSYERFPIVDEDGDDILDSSEFKSGDYARCSFNAGAYDHPEGGKGVSYWFNSIQKLRDGEPLGAHSSSPDKDYAGNDYDEGDYEDDDL